MKALYHHFFICILTISISLTGMMSCSSSTYTNVPAEEKQHLEKLEETVLERKTLLDKESNEAKEAIEALLKEI